MSETKSKLLSTTIAGLCLSAGVAFSMGGAVAATSDSLQNAIANPTAIAKPMLLAGCGAGKPCNPCNPCNPCAVKKVNPCNPCAAANPCAANPCNPCNPCAAKKPNPCAAS